jgi:hypothetical protein
LWCCNGAVLCSRFDLLFSLLKGSYGVYSAVKSKPENE